MLVGIISRQDLLRDNDQAHSLQEVASRDVVTTSPDDPLTSALRTLVDENVDHLPVVADGKLVGMLTRTDILHYRARQLRADEHDGHRLRFRARQEVASHPAPAESKRRRP